MHEIGAERLQRRQAAAPAIAPGRSLRAWTILGVRTRKAMKYMPMLPRLPEPRGE
jgi:hypothetical protein